MPPRKIRPPELPEYSTGQIAAMLPEMPVPEIVFEAVKIKSDQAMRMALSAGVKINAGYKFSDEKMVFLSSEPL